MDETSGYHFTYRKPDGDLGQGDLVEKSEEVQALLREVHPHYAKDDYTHLLVLTQSCDLVRRKEGTCKARYISLAAVRPLSLVLEREIEKYQDNFAREAGVCSKGEQSETKRELEEFVERLFNNNDPEFFYLEPQLDLGLSEASCAFLRLSIAVRGQEHYEKLCDARVLTLTDVFQAKLGWLVGNMYSRVGTPDWVPERVPTRSQFRKKIEKVLGAMVQWVDDEQLIMARKDRPAATASREDLRKHIKQTAVPTRKNLVLDAVLGVVQRENLVPPEEAAKLRRLLGNDPSLSSLLKA